MPDHIHLAGQLNDGTLSALMNTLKGYTGYRIAKLPGISSPIWGRGFHDHALRSEESYRSMLNYLLNNPVRSGLVHDYHDYPNWWCRFSV